MKNAFNIVFLSRCLINKNENDKPETGETKFAKRNPNNVSNKLLERKKYKKNKMENNCNA